MALATSGYPLGFRAAASISSALEAGICRPRNPARPVGSGSAAWILAALVRERALKQRFLAEIFLTGLIRGFRF
jgi:hypothetical protein